MGLRLKILSGFLILVMMLAIAGAVSIYELNQMGSSVQQFLNDNYKSIQYSNQMLNSLEEENNAILLLLNGNWDEGRAGLKKADSIFEENLSLAKNNITMEEEKEFLSKISENYSAFKQKWLHPIVDTPRQGNLKWYYENIFNDINFIRGNIKNIIRVNDEAIYKVSKELKAQSNRAVMPGIIAVLAGLLFTFIFTYFINYYFVSPIIKMKRKVKDYIEKKTPFIKEVETNDEMSELEDSIKLLCEINTSMEE